MKPPPQQRIEYEKVKVDEFLPGVIEDINYEENHKFTFKGVETVQPGVRFKFKLEGYKHPHYSRWLKFNYGEKANLYKVFLAHLVENAKPDMVDFDLDGVKGMKVKTMWSQNGDFQNLELIRPLNGKVKYQPSKEAPLADAVESEDEVPF